MAEIHILAHDRDTNLLPRAYDMLKHRFEVGEDLGPRIHHIQSLVSSLELSLRGLLQLMAGLGYVVGLRCQPEAGAAPARPSTLPCIEAEALLKGPLSPRGATLQRDAPEAPFP